MREPRWVRPIARVYVIVLSAFWVTASLANLSRWIVAQTLDLDGCRCVTKAGALVCALCATDPPVWVSGIVGVLGVLAAYLAARLTRPRVL